MPRDSLFDLAVARAHAHARATGLLRPGHAPPPERDALMRGLELWYLKTRFAYRVPLEDVAAALERHPEAGREAGTEAGTEATPGARQGARGAVWVWRGGPNGRWEPR